MERHSLLWLGLFISLSLAEVAAEVSGYRPIILWTKPFLMPVLAFWFVRRTPGVRRFLRQTVLAGLLFATLGDILLMLTGGKYDTLFFLMGLGAFLGTHICYLGGFLSEVSWQTGYLRKNPVWVLPFLFYVLALLIWLWPGILPGMRLPVSVYAAVISAMALGVLNLRTEVAKDMFVRTFTGALLFICSDSLIALLKFGQPFPGARVMIMATYLIGQWLIVSGVAERLRRIPENKV